MHVSSGAIHMEEFLITAINCANTKLDLTEVKIYEDVPWRGFEELANPNGVIVFSGTIL
jgi:hypothetical protein